MQPPVGQFAPFPYQPAPVRLLPAVPPPRLVPRSVPALVDEGVRVVRRDIGLFAAAAAFTVIPAHLLSAFISTLFTPFNPLDPSTYARVGAHAAVTTNATATFAITVARRLHHPGDPDARHGRARHHRGAADARPALHARRGVCARPPALLVAARRIAAFDPRRRRDDGLYLLHRRAVRPLPLCQLATRAAGDRAGRAAGGRGVGAEQPPRRAAHGGGWRGC